MPFHRNLILIGFPGTGKTQTGRLAARLLDWEFVDTDEVITSRTGRSVDDIFARDGENAFRRMEREAVRWACSSHDRVIGTGGGSFMDPQNQSTMLEAGLVVCLEASPATIQRRLSSAPGAEVRPLLRATDPMQRINELKASRQPSYNMAHSSVDTEGRTEEQVASELVRLWQATAGEHGGVSMDEDELAATVHHAGGSYPVIVGKGVLAQLGPRLKDSGASGQAYIISDNNVFRGYGREAQRSLEASGIATHSYSFPPGEESKSLAMAEHIYAWLAEARAERGHTIVALGGGVAGDLAGFVAATFLRGMRFVQVPTSMAAMVDASIGGKVAVNLPQGKNLVGAFYQPSLVLADVDTLSTLGQRELAEGWAEAVKHGLILDAELFDLFEEHAEDLASLRGEIVTQVIRRSVAIKAQVVSGDERETLGRRILLNYGHSIGHGLEAASGYGQYMHGEAVAIGMMGAARISHAMGLIPEEVILRQQRVLHRLGLPLTASGVDPDTVLERMTHDKKTEAGSIRWVLLEAVGQSVVRRDVPAELVQETVRDLSR